MVILHYGVEIVYDKMGGSNDLMCHDLGCDRCYIDATNVSGPFGAISSNSWALPPCDNSLALQGSANPKDGVFCFI